MWIKNISMITLAFAAAYCTKKNDSFPDSKDFENRCGLDSRILEHNRVVFIEKEKTRLFREEFTAFPYQVSSKGCVIIPEASVQDLVVRSEDHGKSVDVKTLKTGFAKEPIRLEKFQDNFDVWSYCGEKLNDHEAFLKFENPHDIKQNAIYFDQFGEEHPLKLNDRFCAKIPALPGRVMNGQETYSTLFQVDLVTFVGKDPRQEGNFLSICQARGIHDPIVRAFAQEEGTNDCNELWTRLRQREVVTGTLDGKGIRDLTALNGLNFKKLFLRNNKIRSLEPLRNMSKLEDLSLHHNEIMFLDGIPDVLNLGISGNPVGTLKTLGGKRLYSLNMPGLPLKNLNGLEKHKNTLVALVVAGMKNLEHCEQVGHLNKLFQLHANENSCVAKVITKGSSQIMVRLELDHTGLSDMSWIKNYPTVKTLNLEFNDIRDLKEIGELEQLMVLTLSGNNNISSFDPIGHISSLLSLRAHATGLKDLSFLQNLEQLTSLSVEQNQITDLRPLESSHRLSEIFADKNPLIHCPTNRGPDSLRAFCQRYLRENPGT